MASTPTTLTLNDGTSLPAIGFGTYPLKGEDGIEAMVAALENGYRHLDTAVNYGNEAEVGEALRRSGIPREEVVVATKIPGRFHAEDLALQSLRDSAERLGLEQIDLGLIQWPNPSRDLYPQAWRALVRAREEGLVRTVGVSNVTPEHLRRVIEDTGVTLAVNQIELHPYFPQADALAFHREKGILTEAWSPLGRGTGLLGEPVIGEIARAHGVSPARAVLGWHVARGAIPLPKAATPARQRENLQMFDVGLSDQEIARISALGRPDGRLAGQDPAGYEEF